MTRLRAWFTSLSLHSRVAMLSAALVGVAIAVTSAVAYVTVRAETYDRLDGTLVARAQSAASFRNSDALSDYPPARLGAADVRIAVMDADGQAHAYGTSTAPPLGEPELRVARRLDEVSLRTATQNGVTYRVVAVPSDVGTALVMAQDLAPTERMLGRLGVILFFVGAAGVMVAAVGGLAVARAGLRPVERLTAAAVHVARTEQLAPIEVRGHDELARLAESFNAMLAALARSRARQQQLVADAGHELRTPLTSLRTNLDLLAQSTAAGAALPAADRDELMADVRAQVEELTGLVHDLVELARDDPPAASDELVDLVAVCERALDRVRRRAPKVTFEAMLNPWFVRGDATVLERAVTNLLDNAAKWSPPDGIVTLTLDGGEVRVADQGPGIAAADLPHVFERFYRASDARTLPGSGLGLAIVRRAAERHGGSVGAGRSPAGGALLTLRLPPAPVDATGQTAFFSTS